MTITTAIEKRSSMIKLFEAARRCGVPLLSIETVDQTATIDVIRNSTFDDENGTHSFDSHPMMQWDAARGMIGANKLGTAAIEKLGITPKETYGFLEAMLVANDLPEYSILFVRDADRQMHSGEPRETAGAIASVAALRDVYKLNFRTVVFLGPSFKAPTELGHDVISIAHGLPTRGELEAVILDLFAAVKLPKPKPDVLARAVDAVTGLSTFETEQIVSMSFTDSGLDQDALLERKRAAIESIDGLSVVRSTTTFADLRGIASAKRRLASHKNAKTPIGVVVWIDEGSDVFAAVESGGDNNKLDQQRLLLMRMEEKGWRGVIFVGVPGSGKSALASAFGNECGVPAISVDFGAMENKYVGESEARVRAAFDVVERVGDGHAFLVLTCNSLRGIRPQFQRRFKRGIFFFDLPTSEERGDLWAYYMKKFGLAKQAMPDDDGWTGAEIRECCESAWDTGVSLVEAAKFIIPVSRSRATEIDEMRKEANGRFLDASRDGAFTYRPEPMAKQVRAIALPAATK